MEYSKLSLEMTSPDYIDHFYSLSQEKKKEILKEQDQLYKGINFSLINEIYDVLYLKSLERDTSFIQLHTHSELTSVAANDTNLLLHFYHSELEKDFEHRTGVIILATGYKSVFPSFLESIKEQLQLMGDGVYNVTSQLLN